jgi:hypothetical protein
MNSTLADDMERLMGWQKNYILAHPKPRKWMDRLKNGSIGEVWDLIKEVKEDADMTPEVILFRSYLTKLSERK